MAVNKVMVGDRILIDMSGDTVTPETMQEGITGHDARGEPITGTHTCADIGTGAYVWAIYDTKKVWDYTIKNLTGTTKPSGYSDATYNQKEITEDGYWKLTTKTGSTTSSDAYYLPEGIENGKAKTILRKSAYSYVNPYSTYTIKDNQDTVQGDNLRGYISADTSDAYPEKGLKNEKYYIRIAGPDADITASKMLSGIIGYRNTGKIIGSIQSQAAQTITPGTTDKTIASGKYLTGTQTIKGDPNLLSENIKEGIEIFGIPGGYKAGSVAQGTVTASGTDAVIIDTGLEKVSAFILFAKTTLTSQTGVQCLYYDGSSVQALGTNYSSYLSTSTTSRGEVTVDGGTVTYTGKDGTAASFLVDGKVYNWIAIE